MSQMPGAGLGLVGLDGRRMTGGTHGAPDADHAGGDMTLRLASFGKHRKLSAGWRHPRSGYPRMVLSGDELLFAWMDRDSTSPVCTARARVQR